MPDGSAPSFRRFGPDLPHAQPHPPASVMGALGAVFSVVVRAQAFELKPCDDSRPNESVGALRVGMGGSAAPALLLSGVAVFAGNVETSFGHDPAPANSAFDALVWVATPGPIGGFAERLVPDFVRGGADEAVARAGTPVQAAEAWPRTGCDPTASPRRGRTAQPRFSPFESSASR